MMKLATILLLATTLFQSTIAEPDVKLTCTREDFVEDDCKAGIDGKTVNDMILEHLQTCTSLATKGAIDKALDRDNGPTDNEHARALSDTLVEADSNEDNLRLLPTCIRGGCYDCGHVCCLMGYCAGTCCSCSCNRRERKLARAAGGDDREATIAKVCSDNMKAIAVKLAAVGNYCFGKDPMKVDCYATVFDNEEPKWLRA